jgi:hypothetical protein
MNRPTEHHPPVRIDEELVATLRWLDGRVPTSLELADIPRFRQAASAAAPTDDVLTLDGHFDVSHLVAGDAHEVPLMLCRPNNQGPQPLLLFLHGGGMVVGDARTGMLETLKYAKAVGMAGWLPSIHTRLPWTTARWRWRGSIPTPSDSGSTPAASWWRARVLVAAWLQRCAYGSVTTAARRSPDSS